MKKLLLYSYISLLFIGCASRQTENMLRSGDYDASIDIALNKLRNRKEAKGKQEFIYFLEEAFAKAKERDLETIAVLAKDANPANFEKIFNLYQNLNNRQQRIKPVLPLKLNRENRNAIFPFEDYSDQIVSSKNSLSKYLYDNSKGLLGTKDKMNYRRAFDDLTYLNNLNPNYKDVANLINEARTKGTDYVNVYTKNETNMVIPVRLQNDLLDFSTLGLNEKWTVYHSNKVQDIRYDYGIIVNFREINISPEQIREKEITQEKQIKDGVKTLFDSNGNIVRDSIGNPIKVDNFKTVRATIYQFSQFKACQVTAKVDYIDFNTNQLLQTYPLASEFIFEHIYANYRGDKLACDDLYLPYFNNRAVPFPSNEQMVYDTGEDLKLKLKNIITRNRIRR